MSIVRIQHNKDNPYVQLNKKALEDKNLSWAAKGLWAYLMSRPDDWKVSVAHLSKIYDGRGGKESAIYKILNELIEYGYCERVQLKGDKGLFSSTEYIIHEFKIISPLRDNRDAEDRDPVKPKTTKERVKQKKEEDNNKATSSRVSSSEEEEERQAIEEILSVNEEAGLKFTPELIKKHCKKYSYEIVREKVLVYFKTYTKKKRSADNPNAWLTSALKQDYTNQKDT